MKKKPSLDEFRAGGGEIVPGSTAAPASSNAKVPLVDERTNKTIRIRKTLEMRLKEDAFRRSQAEGRRVTESDIIDEALELYWQSKT